MATPQPLAQSFAGDGSTVHRAILSPNGKILALFQQHPVLWDIQAGRPLLRLPDNVQTLVFSPNSKLVATDQCLQADRDTGLCTVSQVALQVVGQTTPSVLPFPERIAAADELTFSPDGNSLAADVTLASGTGEIALWNVHTHQQLPITFHGRQIGGAVGLVFAPNSQTLQLSGCFDVPNQGPNQGCANEITAWDIDRGTLLRSHSLPEVGSLATGIEPLNGIVTSPDNKIMAIYSQNMTEIIDATTERVLAQPDIANVSAVALAPDDRTLAIGYCQGISGSSFQCATPSIQLWDIAAQRTIGPPLSGHTDEVQSIEFDPTGGTLMSAGYGESHVLLWDVSVQSWVHRVCRIAERQLSQAEWQQYVGDIRYQNVC
jgi:WD40 repeat protein